MEKIKIEKSEKIQNEYSIKCPYCEEGRVIRGTSQNGVQANYEFHLWYNHKTEIKK